MTGVLWGIGLALLAAAGVIAAASAWGDESGALRTFWTDLRTVLRRRRAGETVPGASAAAEPAPVDVPFAEMFAAESEPDDGYLQLDELGDLLDRTLDRTGERAGRLLHAPHHAPRGAARTSSASGTVPAAVPRSAGPRRTSTPLQREAHEAVAVRDGRESREPRDTHA